jgi:mono/diheme cytochrome c family protein
MKTTKGYFGPALLAFLIFVATLDSAWSADSTPSMRHGWNVLTGEPAPFIGIHDDASVLRGEKLFQTHCMKCHGVPGFRDGQYARTMGLNPANLKALSGQVSNISLFVQINAGKNSMPQWEDLLKNEEVWDLTNYIQSLAKEKKKEIKKKN